MLDMTVNDFFASLGAARFLPELRNVNAKYRYDIRGAGRWLVHVQNGALEVEQESEDRAAEVDATVICDAPDFLEIVQGGRNAVTAVMQGRLIYRGPLEHILNQSQVLDAAAFGFGKSRRGDVAQNQSEEDARR